MEIAAALAIVLAAAVITGVTGFGFALVFVPPLLLIYDPETVVAVRLLLALTSAWLPLLGVWRSTRTAYLRRVLPTAYLGLAAGVVVLLYLPSTMLKLLASVVVVAFAILLLVLRDRPLPIADGPRADRVAGLLSGLLSTSTGLTGPPVVILFTARGYSIPAFRATIMVYFLALDLVAFPAFLLTGVISVEDVRLAAILTPAALLGRFGGAALVKHISPLAFRRLTLYLLVLTGLIGIIAAARSLTP